MKISIVLSTYNGEKYLLEQLDSLRLQTVTPDEVLICDDCSTDETVPMIQAYLEQYQLTHWNLAVNQTNAGWRKNFTELAFRATGELIFFCDQDDIWHLNKLASMSAWMEKDKTLQLLCSDFVLLYMENSVKKEQRSISALKLDSSFEKITTHRALWRSDRPGCTYCMRSTLVQMMKDTWSESWSHDELAWKLAALTGSLAILHEPLIQFRRHESNTTGREQRTRAKRLADVRYMIETFETLLRFGAEGKQQVSEKNMRYLHKYKLIQHKRLHALQQQSLLSWVAMLPYAGHYPALRMYLGDGWNILKNR